MSPFITPQEMAKALGVSVSTIYAYAKVGIIPVAFSGERPVMHRADFETWLKGGLTACGWLRTPPNEATRVAIELRVNGKEIGGNGQ